MSGFARLSWRGGSRRAGCAFSNTLAREITSSCCASAARGKFLKRGTLLRNCILHNYFTRFLNNFIQRKKGGVRGAAPTDFCARVLAFLGSSTRRQVEGIAWRRCSLAPKCLHSVARELALGWALGRSFGLRFGPSGTQSATQSAIQSATQSDTQSETRFGARSATQSGTHSGTQSDTQSGSQFGTHSGTRSGTRSGA